MNELIKHREECNIILNKIISFHSALNPDLRYIQNLWTLGIIDHKYSPERSTSNYFIIDRVNEESYQTIVRILPKIIDLINNNIKMEDLPESVRFDNMVELECIICWLEKLKFIQREPDNQIKISNQLNI